MRQLMLLDKSLEHEKQKIAEKVLIAPEDATKVEFNDHLEEVLPQNQEKAHAFFIIVPDRKEIPSVGLVVRLV